MNKISIELIPEEENNALARCLLNSMKAFFEIPENRKQFQEWEKSQKTA